MKQIILIIYILFSLIQIGYPQSKEELNIQMLEAAKNDQADVVKYWLEKGGDVNFADTKGYVSLNYAASNSTDFFKK